MNRFFVQQGLSIGEDLCLPDEVTHHWCRVLRAKVGDVAILFDGQGGEYAATLTQIDKKSAKVHINDFNPINRTPMFQATIGLVISKGDRMDYAIQKACEMGVSHIQLLTSERCQEPLKYERNRKKIAHWQGIAVAACEQCGLNKIPAIAPAKTLDEWVASCTDELKLVLALSDGKPDFHHPLPNTVALLIGGEGGLSPREMALAKSHGFTPWTIGERVLRTETAPVVALTALQIIYGMA
ncbi:16S rRNA (uracil(1498)-N(3))-methyltransferase [Moraxella sp. Tifton1]|uniref:16S rRNA (uracil(1498)-N(3))-methyltransferase n=1 Tax=Moraxella oculi TaxID=2940516 RepID=UPI00201385F8|nr:16S rRNA (uracil(1498)-N(3))-methyltransferase [Moraxella sp. Tifton1]MCL1623556.1 16S rRNA (uracil(1498)-N(3))-methyltransferase [Moraxella sp. Tifton1]